MIIHIYVARNVFMGIPKYNIYRYLTITGFPYHKELMTWEEYLESQFFKLLTKRTIILIVMPNHILFL